MSLITAPFRWACKGLCVLCCAAGCVIGVLFLVNGASWPF